MLVSDPLALADLPDVLGAAEDAFEPAVDAFDRVL